MPSSGEAAAPEAAGQSPGSTGGGGAAGVETPKAQVVQVVLSNGSSDVRLAELDNEGGRLILWQLMHSDSGEVEVGNQASVKLASIGDAAIEESSVLLHAAGFPGRVLIRLNFSDEPLARTWARALRAGCARARSGAQREAEAKPASEEAEPEDAEEESTAGKTPVEMLRILLVQLEQQAELMETINKRKEDHLFETQAELEWALERLQEGQEEYARNQRELESRQVVIEGLRQRLQTAGAAEAACMANAMQASAGAAAAARAGATGPVVRVAAAPAALGAVGSVPKPPAVALTSPSGSARASPMAVACSPAASAVLASPAGAPKAPAPSPKAGPPQLDKDQEQQSQRQLLGKLQSLEAEKGRLERELREEQGEILAQLRDLQGMMASLGL
uniref:PH domain-containing protein n=1 Tax=Alexandrium monilatum TaxID=311494 RepID=A0A6T0RSE5_9DINO